MKLYGVSLVHLSQDSEALKKGEADISLEVVPRNHSLIKMTELREEGGSMLETLLTLIASHTISRLVLLAKKSIEHYIRESKEKKSTIEKCCLVAIIGIVTL